MEETKLQQAPAPAPAPAHIIILPSPGVGHLIPLVEFAKQLVVKHQFSVTITIPSSTSPSEAETSILNKLPKSVNSIFLSPVNLDDLPADTKIETIIFETMLRSLPSLRDAFIKILTPSNSTHVAALVVDIFGTDAFDIANEFQVLPFIFHPSTATTLSLFFHLHELDRVHSGEFRDLTEPVNLPGCPPFYGTELVDPMQDRKNESYKCLLHMAKGYKSAKGVLVNSFNELESGAFEALSTPENLYPPVYPIGPLIQTELTRGSSNDSSTEYHCLNWLDHQPVGSVIYVCLGSGGTLSHKQIIEMAFGLEKSEQRFLWVFRSPNDEIANATFFGEKSSTKDPLDFLPKGFLERTKGLGLVVRSWAPQIQVLSHGSTGGFLSHCGWNSTLEGVCNGVPFIAWPLYAEQRMNARMLVDELKVALRPKAEENGVVGREEIARVVKVLIEEEEGKRVSNSVRELQNAARRVLGEDGSSTKALAEVVNQWKNHKNSTYICK